MLLRRVDISSISSTRFHVTAASRTELPSDIFTPPVISSAYDMYAFFQLHAADNISRFHYQYFHQPQFHCL
jgi:hypothetical protein